VKEAEQLAADAAARRPIDDGSPAVELAFDVHDLADVIRFSLEAHGMLAHLCQAELARIRPGSEVPLELARRLKIATDCLLAYSRGRGEAPVADEETEATPADPLAAIKLHAAAP
jgi:hypothetical protein